MASSKLHTNDSEADEFINIWMSEERQAPATDMQKDGKDFYGKWVDQSSAKLSIPIVTGAEALRGLYPNHSLVLTQGYGMDILGFPKASITPIEKTPLLSNLVFIPLSRNVGIPGVLADQVSFGAFKVTWQQFEYIIYSVQYPQGFGILTQYFILHDGPEEVSRLFLLSAGAWADSLHDEIWVFNQGFWRKNHGLWSEIQKADWKDVILKEEFKKALQKDVYGFFASEAIYKELAIPWKRGLIMHGPPGNGKTISLKTIMKTCGDKGFPPLYVKSFQSYKGEEGAMADVFDKARQLAPCLIILEDLDSLINDRNRSFFLNQLDGLESNDGLLIIGTTNHFERLDPGISTRPSRFDRKYKFDDPDEDERKQYAQYWQNKLKSNKEIDFPDELVSKVAQQTDKFSFAYLKEAFVSSLVTFVGIEGEKPSFKSVLLHQIETLRKQLDKPGSNSADTGPNTPAVGKMSRALPPSPSAPPPRRDTHDRDIRALLDNLSEKAPRIDTNSSLESVSRASMRRQALLAELRKNRKNLDPADVRAIMDSLSTSIPSLDTIPAYVVSQTRKSGTSLQIDEEVNTFRSLLDRIAQNPNPNPNAPENNRFYYSPDADTPQLPSGSQYTDRGSTDESRGSGNACFGGNFSGLA